MRILFFGNADFGIPSLHYLHNSSNNLLSVVTNKDKKFGRGNKYSLTPIKEYSLKNNINIIEADNLSDSDFIIRIQGLKPDLIIVIAYRILPQEIFAIPTYGTVNLHASLLPKYRGAAPIQRAILNNEKETGITTFFIDKKIDTGSIILQKKIKINKADSFGDIYTLLSKEGPIIIKKTIKHILDGKPSLNQKDGHTYAKKIKKNENQIKWTSSSQEVVNIIRAFSPSPGAFSYLSDKRVKLLRGKEIKYHKINNPGEISINSGKFIVGTSMGAVEILELQLEGKRVMGAAEVINGFQSLNKKQLKFEFKK